MSARLTKAQRELLKRAAEAPFGIVHVRDMRPASALTKAGLFRHHGTDGCVIGSVAYGITDAGRAAIALATGQQGGA